MNQEYCQYYKPTIWSRLNRFLFPYAPRPHLENDNRTYLTTNIFVDIDWLDRLRLLFSGYIKVVVITYTNVEVESATSVSSFEVQPPKRN